MKATGNIADEILVKYLLNEATTSERSAVDQWLQASEANRTHLSQLSAVWEQSGRMAAPAQPDADEAWARFRQRTQQPRKVVPVPAPAKFRWVRVAALLAVLAGGAWLGYTLLSDHDQTPQVVATPPAPAQPIAAARPETTENIPQAPAEPARQEPAPVATPRVHKAANSTIAVKTNKKFLQPTYAAGIFKYDRTKDFICNNTPCPIEICIRQSIKCANGQTEDVSTCSVLEPDESGQLRYKAFDKITHTCRTTVDEITIKRLSTGETIVLNAESKPATAQEFFSYITGEKKGDITAGIFHTDCNNNEDDCGLTFNNSNLILQ